MTTRARAQQPLDPSQGLPTFDIRVDADKNAAAQAYLARFVPEASSAARRAIADARDQALARLRADVPDAIAIDSPELGLPEVVGTRPGRGFLTSEGQNHVQTLRAFLAANADLYGVPAGQLAALTVVADYQDPGGSMSWVELEQRLNGLPVFRGTLRAGFTGSGQLVRTTGNLAAAVDPSALGVAPAIDAATAIARAAGYAGMTVNPSAIAQVGTDNGRLVFSRGPLVANPRVSPLYFPLAPGVVRLAWQAEIWGEPNSYLVIVDAEDGTLLFRKNATNAQTQSATYRIYQNDSPGPMSPSTTTPDVGGQATPITATLVAKIGNEAPNTFNNLGWITDGAADTQGNNVIAGIDVVAPDGVDATTPATSGRTFDYVVDTTVTAPSDATYRAAEVVDMFYWTNYYHDALYNLGFTEGARNFQDNNFARGGLGADRVSAQSQDSSGTNNANFTTFPDGTQSKAQMYVFNGPTPDRAGALDHDVLLHELTHGVSNRLHANASGLATTMSGAMGEGWSDFYARALNSGPDEPTTLAGNGWYTVGGWATNNFLGLLGNQNYYYGIRRFPYALKTILGSNGKPHNPLTFADIDSNQIDTTDGAYAISPWISNSPFTVHNAGEVWCVALFEVRARLIARYGWAAGNQKILLWVTDGMKLDAASPTFLSGRDSIIAAAQSNGATQQDIDDIWAGFAARGMGTGAQITDLAAGHVIESFTVPGGPQPAFSINDVAVTEGNSGTKTMTFTVTLANPSGGTSTVAFATQDNTAVQNVVTFSASPGMTIPASGTGATGGAPANPYPLTLNAAGLSGTILKVQPRLNGLTHTFPGDLDILLTGPAGQKVMLMSDAGTSGDVNGVNLTFDDAAAPLTIGQITTGTSAPTNLEPGEDLPSPAPAGPYATTLSTFNGTNPNGTWSLYVSDDASGDTGSLAGLALMFSTSAGTGDYVPAGGVLSFPSGTTSQTVSVTILGDAAVEPNETFFVNLSNPTNAIIADNQGIGTITNDDGVVATAPNDVDGDGKSDLAVFRPGTGVWYLAKSTTNYATSSAFVWGQAGDVPVEGDFDADGKIDLVVFRPSTGAWYVSKSTTSYVSVNSYNWGSPGDVPLGGDFDGDHKTDLAVFRPSTGVWYISPSSTNYATSANYTWGQPGDVPRTGDFDGDGKTDLVVFRPSSGAWFIAKSTGNYATSAGFTFGTSADAPVSGDFDGDGKMDLAVFRASTGAWYYSPSTTNYTTTASFTFGLPGDVPVPGDFDADGKTDLAVFRPTGGGWFYARSTTNYTTSGAATFGSAGDVPVGHAALPETDSTRRSDFEGDLRADLAVFRSSTGVWYTANARTNYASGLTLPFGQNGDVPVPGDYDGDTRTDPAIFRPSNSAWFVAKSSTSFATTFSMVFGQAGDLPAPGDFDGDGRTDLAVFRPSSGQWFVATSSANYALTIALTFGANGDVPVPGDWDGDGKTDVAVFRPSTAAWYFAKSSTNFATSAAFTYGLPTDIPITGDFDGDRRADLAVFRPSSGTWFFAASSTNFGVTTGVGFGSNGDSPVPADFDGDGRTDVAVFRPSTGTWYFAKSSTNFATFGAVTFGLGTDIPVYRRQ